MAGCVSMSGLVYRLEGESPNLFLFLTLFLCAHLLIVRLHLFLVHRIGGGNGLLMALHGTDLAFLRFFAFGIVKHRTLVVWPWVVAKQFLFPVNGFPTGLTARSPME